MFDNLIVGYCFADHEVLHAEYNLLQIFESGTGKAMRVRVEKSMCFFEDTLPFGFSHPFLLFMQQKGNCGGMRIRMKKITHR